MPKEIRASLWSIGRLDYQTSGLIILTNDGELTQKLSHPSFEHEKEYEVALDKTPTQQQLDLLSQGVKIDGKKTYPAEVSLFSPHPSKVVESGSVSPPGSRGRLREGVIITITIHEGRNRQVRKMIEAVGLKVKDLKRIRIGKLKLPKDLPVGQFIELNKEDII